MRITIALAATAKEMYCQFYDEQHPNAIIDGKTSWQFKLSEQSRMVWYKKAQRVIDAYLRAK